MTPDGGLDSDAASKYSGGVGTVIRDRVPMLWPDWSEVPQVVKNRVNNAMSVTNLIQKHLILIFKINFTFFTLL